MASLLSQPNFISLTTYNNFKPKTTLPSSLVVGTSTTRRFRRYVTVSEQATANSPAVRKLYVGNIPRTVNNDELAQIVQEHGAVEKAEVIFICWKFGILICVCLD
jgi:polyadenylate-binding protein